MAKRPAEEELSMKRRKSFGSWKEVDDTRIGGINALVPPVCLLEELPLEMHHLETITEGRKAIEGALDGTDNRLVVIVGPCSVHDVKSAVEYAHKLKKLASKHEKELVVVMRVYFEKPRTTVGWKGLINDPDLDGSNHINKGLRMARTLLLEISAIGLPIAVEFLDTITPQFLADCVSWGAIGARTTESQVHRELASGLSMPVGFKNATSGDIKIACDAIQAAGNPHSFLSVTKQGLAAVVHTNGNPYGHVILRGGSTGTNYDSASIASTKEMMEKGSCKPWIVVDCSHGNSQKKHSNQPIVATDLAKQISAGNQSIKGLMIESNIHEGNQKLDPGKTMVKNLKYGVSVTDACIDFETTEKVLAELATASRERAEKLKFHSSY